MYGMISDPGMGLYPPPVPLAPWTQATLRSANRVGASTPFGAASTRGIAVFVPVGGIFGDIEEFLKPGCRDGILSSPCALESPCPYGWHYPIQHQPSRKESAASGRDLIGHSEARIVFQNCVATCKPVP